MQAPRAVIFDLGGTLVDWPDWTGGVSRCWGLSYDYLVATEPGGDWPERGAYVQAMLEAEAEHWRRVREEQGSSNTSQSKNKLINIRRGEGG